MAEEEDGEVWSEVCEQCSGSHCVGHALLMALLGHQFVLEDGLESGEKVRGRRSGAVYLAYCQMDSSITSGNIFFRGSHVYLS